MKVGAHPLVVAVALGLLGPGVLSEVPDAGRSGGRTVVGEHDADGNGDDGEPCPGAVDEA